MRIRSDRRTWRIERRIYALPWKGDEDLPLSKLGLPNGIPLKGVGYGAAVWAILFVVARLPLLGAPIAALPWPMRWWVLPLVTAYYVTTQRLDGARPHAWLWAFLRYHARQLADRRAARPIRMRGHLRVIWREDER